MELTGDYVDDEIYFLEENIPILYGPPTKRIHTCTKCGYSWYWIGPRDKGRYCPKCGGDAPVVSIIDFPDWVEED